MPDANPPAVDTLNPAVSTPAPLTAPPDNDAETVKPFESTQERKFELYMQQRSNYSEGARNAYQRFDQTIVALSGGSIVLSVTFMKDIGHIPETLPWLFGSWACFLVASLSAFLSLLTSGEADRERMTQLDCSVWSGECDESRADRLGRVTTGLNYLALTTCILGVILIIIFATNNLLQIGGNQWPREKGKTLPSPPISGTQATSSADVPTSATAEEASGPAETPSTTTAAPSEAGTASAEGSSSQPIQERKSPNP